MIPPNLIAEARTKIAARNEARKALEALQAEIESVTQQQPEAHDAAEAAQREWEAALAGSGDATKTRAAYTAAKEKLEELDAREAGLERRVEALEIDHAQKRSAAATVLVRIAKSRAAEMAEETRRLARIIADNHAKWHRIAGGASAIATEAAGTYSEPIPARDPGASTLRGHRGKFDEGLEEEFRAAGLAAGGGMWWGPSGRLAPMSEAELLAEDADK